MDKQQYNGPERRSQAWHLDKKVPIVFFFMLLSQFGATIWWAGEINGATKENTKSSIELIKRVSEIEARERDSNKLVERVVRVETMLENVQHTVNRIDNLTTEESRRKR